METEKQAMTLDTLNSSQRIIAEDIKTPRLVGETYMKSPTRGGANPVRYGIFECQYCGKHWESLLKAVKYGHTKSCGCYRSKIKSTHGMRSHRFYNTWITMRGRCLNIKDKNYKNYGGRGITVCEEWLDVRNFVAWAESTHPNIEGLSLDRIDNDLGYSPENCRWADRSTQNINQRISKRNTSGFVGVNWSKSKSIWVANIKHHKVLKYVGGFKTKEEAVLARDQYIIKNKLPHKLSTQY